MWEDLSMVPELPELPVIREHSLRAFRTQEAMSRRLPGIPNIAIQSLTGYNPRAEAAAAYAAAVRVAFEITRRQQHVAEMRAREADRASQYLAQRRRAWWR